MMKMKKFSNLLLILVIGFSFTTCERDNEGPSLSLLNGNAITADATVSPGDSLMFHWLAEPGDNNLEQFNIVKQDVDLTGFPRTDIPNDTYEDSVILLASQNPGTYIYKFIITDTDGQTAEENVTITVQQGNVETHNVTLEVASSAGTTENNCATEDGTVFTYQQAEANISLQQSCDFVYYYITDAVISAPDAVSSQINNGYSQWEVFNATKFSENPVTIDFDNIPANDDSQIVDVAQNLTASQATNLQVGDIYAFETVDGIKGVFRVDELAEGFTTDKLIVITIKGQAETK